MNNTVEEKRKLYNLSIYVTNQPGVLVRVALVFSRRNFNIESLIVSGSRDDKRSRMTITAIGNKAELEQVIKQLNKLIDVLHIDNHEHDQVVEQELCLVKVNVNDDEVTTLLQIINHFQATTLNMTNNNLIVQICNTKDKIDSFLEILEKYEIIEVIRSGKLLIAKGDGLT